MPETARRICGTMEVHRRLISIDPTYVTNRMRIENLARQYEQGARRILRTGIARIPVVVHVVYNEAGQNVSRAQVDSQIAALNRDYRGRAEAMSSVPGPFREMAGDARIEFALAATDPAGSPSDGITRTRTNLAAFDVDDAVKFAARGGADAWPRDAYLNLWVCQLAQGVLGYAQLPGGPAATDGVVISNTAFGTSGTVTPPFNLGCTTTHEVGHWLNLLHIWGDDGTGCNGDDHVADTPNQAGPNYGVPAFPHVTCDNGPNGDLFVNFMDYTDDVVMQLFTPGQVTRIDATLDGPRAPLLGRTPVPSDPSQPPDPSQPGQPGQGEVPAGPVDTDVLFYDRAAGRAEVWAVDGGGGLSLVRAHDGWGHTWDAVAAGDLGSGRDLLLYDRAAGRAEVWAVGGGAGLSLVRRYEGWMMTWDAVTAGDLGSGRDLLFYDRSAGRAQVWAVDGGGGLSLARGYKGWGKTWHAVAAGDLGSGRDLLLYDRVAGRAEVWAVDGGGGLSLVRRYEGWGKTWDAVAAGDLGSGRDLLFYDRAAGRAEVWAVDGGGGLSPVRRYEGWGKTWDAVVAADLVPAVTRTSVVTSTGVLSRLRPTPPRPRLAASVRG